MNEREQTYPDGGDEVQRLLVARENCLRAQKDYRSHLKLTAYRVCDVLQIERHFTEVATLMSVENQQYNALAIQYWLHDHLNDQLGCGEEVRFSSIIQTLVNHLADIVPAYQQGDFMQILIGINSVDDAQILAAASATKKAGPGSNDSCV